MLSDFLNTLFLMLLYAAIPCVIAGILRAVFGLRAIRWIALAATVLAVLCFIINIILPDTMLENTVILSVDANVVRMAYVNEWVFIFTQCVLTSSVPGLYCVAFVGKGRAILIALAPSLMFFLSLLIRHISVYSFSEILEVVLRQGILPLMLSSVIFAVWALLLIFISPLFYMLLNRPKIIKHTYKISAGVLIFSLMLATLTLFRSNQHELIRTYDERRCGRYEFSYRNSVLFIGKEIFDEYELTDRHIQRFFSDAEIVYRKLRDFFPRYDFPGTVTYHAVPMPWSFESAYADYYYGDKNHLDSWAAPCTNQIFYEESLFARHLSMIDIGFPSVVCRELGVLFTTSASAPFQYYNAPYVWNAELFAVLAEYYIASEFPVIHADGEIFTGREWEDIYYNQLFEWVDKYGFKVISDTLKQVNRASPNIESEHRHPLTLFIQFLSQKTGDNIELLGY
jgi:hypothetical protein